MALHSNVTLDPSNAQMLEVVHRGVYTSANAKAIRVNNVYHFWTDNPSLLGAKSAYATAFQAWAAANLLPLLCNTYTSEEVWARFLDDPTDPYAEIPDGAAGGVATDGLPIMTAVCIQMYCQLRGKNYRGSKHYGPIPEAATTKDELSGAGLTAWQALASALDGIALDDGGANYARPILLSKTLSSFPPVGPQVATWADVITCICNKSLGTMRRRSEVRSHGA